MHMKVFCGDQTEKYYKLFVLLYSIKLFFKKMIALTFFLVLEMLVQVQENTFRSKADPFSSLTEFLSLVFILQIRRLAEVAQIRSWFLTNNLK